MRYNFIFEAYKQCDGIADVIFAVHSPESLVPSNYRKEKEFVKRVATSLNIEPGRSRVALILYSNFATVSAELGEKTTMVSFSNLVDGLPHERGETRIDRVLKLARSLFDSRGASRQGVPKVLIVLTSGKQTAAPDALNLRNAARPLHEADVRILAVGIGQDVDENELRAIVVKNEDVFLAPSFDDLVILSGSVANITCEAASKYELFAHHRLSSYPIVLKSLVCCVCCVGMAAFYCC